MFTCDVTKAQCFARTSLTVNNSLFAHSEVSCRFNGKKDNDVLDFGVWLHLKPLDTLYSCFQR